MGKSRQQNDIEPIDDYLDVDAKTAAIAKAREELVSNFLTELKTEIAKIPEKNQSSAIRKINESLKSDYNEIIMIRMVQQAAKQSYNPMNFIRDVLSEHESKKLIMIIRKFDMTGTKSFDDLKKEVEKEMPNPSNNKKSSNMFGLFSPGNNPSNAFVEHEELEISPQKTSKGKKSYSNYTALSNDFDNWWNQNNKLMRGDFENALDRKNANMDELSEYNVSYPSYSYTQFTNKGLSPGAAGGSPLGWKIHVSIDQSDKANRQRGTEIVMGVLERHHVSAFKCANLNINENDHPTQSGKQMTIYYEFDKDKNWETILTEIHQNLSDAGIRPANFGSADKQVGESPYISRRNDALRNGNEVNYISADIATARGADAFNPSKDPDPFAELKLVTEIVTRPRR